MTSSSGVVLAFIGSFRVVASHAKPPLGSVANETVRVVVLVVVVVVGRRRKTKRF